MKKLISNIEMTFAKYFRLYVHNSGFSNPEFIMYDEFHEVFHKTSVIEHQCEYLMEWVLECENLDQLIELSIISSKCSHVIQKWAAKYSLYL